MLRKCVIGFTAAAGVVCVILMILGYFYWPEMLRRNTALLAHVVEQGMADYHAEQGAYPSGDGKAVIAALLGENPSQKSYLRPEFETFVDAHGDVLDSWKQPFRFDRADDGAVKLRSSGPNGTFDDADDLTSDFLNTTP